MNLNEFTSSLPKRWLNINCNILTADTIRANTRITTPAIDAGDILCSSPVRNNFTGGTLSANDIISGVIAINKIVTPGTSDIIIVTLPSGNSLDQAISIFSPPLYFTTQIYATFTGTAVNASPTSVTLRFSLSAGGITTYNGTNPFDLVIYWQEGTAAVDPSKLQIQTTLTFARSVTGWVLYA